ncbi:MAG: c-type cytochrome [Bacteroidetes bacterium]|nr:c-type cytochrome [Bacteroidota bacterium]MBS1607576.1 c-type cytochrome [Bacteroidota bacterium]
MKLSKRISVLFVLSALVFFGVAATKPENNFKNLKVLPKDISHEELGKIMHDFNFALGVKCNFCHAGPKQGEEHSDFSSDEKPEKSIARSMMKMTNKINKKFFHGKSKIGDANAVIAVNCATCHHGAPHPEIEQPKPEEEK